MRAAVVFAALAWRAASGSVLVRTAESLVADCEARPEAAPRPVHAHTFAGVRLQPYLILSRQHSGSTWLAALLGDAPCVVSGDEKFHESAERGERVFAAAAGRRAALEAAAATFGLAPWDADLRARYAALAARPQKFTPWVARHNATLRRGAAAFGFKVMFTQGVLDDLRGWLFDFAVAHGVKLVWLRRRNLLKQHLSSRLAAAAPDGAGRVALDAAALLDLLADHAAEDAAVERALACLETRGVRSRAVAYEDLVAAGPANVVDFLLADVVHRHGACARGGRDKAPRHVRNHTRHPSAYVANWPAVAAALRGTPWRAMADAP